MLDYTTLSRKVDRVHMDLHAYIDLNKEKKREIMKL